MFQILQTNSLSLDHQRIHSSFNISGFDDLEFEPAISQLSGLEKIQYVLKRYTNVVGNTTEKPASVFIRYAIDYRLVIKDKHEYLKSTVLNKALNHQDTLERDLDPSSLKRTEEKYFISLINRLYGATVTQQPYQQAIDDLKRFASSLYKRKELANIRIGTVISFVRNHCSRALTMARLSHNTIRKVMKAVAPSQASRRGRSNPEEINRLSRYMEETYNIKAFAI